MGLIGECEDCGEHAPLRYKPGVPLNRQSRPSVCGMCHAHREQLAREHANEPDF